MLLSHLNRFAVLPLILFIRLYQVTLGPFLTGHCRFQPTCSIYAINALKSHGPFRGSLLALRRLLRCHPLGSAGFDPVPPSRNASISPPVPCEHRLP